MFIVFTDISVLSCFYIDVFLNSTTDFTVDASSVTPDGEGCVRAIVTSPCGAKNGTRVTNNRDGTYQVAYAPNEEGER